MSTPSSRYLYLEELLVFIDTEKQRNQVAIVTVPWFTKK